MILLRIKSVGKGSQVYRLNEKIVDRIIIRIKIDKRRKRKTKGEVKVEIRKRVRNITTKARAKREIMTIEID